MRRVVVIPLSLILITTAFSLVGVGATDPIAAPAQQRQSIQILAVIASDTIRYNESLAVRILVAHDQYLLPEVSLFYIPLIQNRAVGSVWRISRAQVIQVFPGTNETLYSAGVPNSAWGDELPAGTVVVYYVEASDASGTVSTARESDRLNPSILDDKFTFRLVDDVSPSLAPPVIMPEQPASGDEVVASVNATDGKLGSGIGSVVLSCSVDGGPFIDTPMKLQEDGNYFATIPAQEHDHRVTFFVTASDKAGNKAKTEKMTYQVQKNTDEIAAEQRVTLLFASVALLLILIMLVWKRRTVTGFVKQPQAAFSIVILLVFLVAARVALVLWQNWDLWWWNAIILIVLVECWGLVDPRIQGTMHSLFWGGVDFGRSVTRYLTRTFQENPPTILVAAAYALGFGGAISDLAFYLATRNIRSAYTLANFIAEYVFILLALGVIGQLVWLARKKAGPQET